MRSQEFYDEFKKLKSEEEVLEFYKKNGIEKTDEAINELADEELDMVAGGDWGLFHFGKWTPSGNGRICHNYKYPDKFNLEREKFFIVGHISEYKCRECGKYLGYIQIDITSGQTYERWR